MDDGGTSVCIIIVFFVLLLIEAILYGFQKAIVLMNEKEIERKAQEEKDNIIIPTINFKTNVRIKK